MSIIELRKPRISDNMLKPYYIMGTLGDYRELLKKYDLFLMLIERTNISNLAKKDHFVVGLEGELFDLNAKNKKILYSAEEIFPYGLDMRFLFELKGYHGLMYLPDDYLNKNIQRINEINVEYDNSVSDEFLILQI